MGSRDARSRRAAWEDAKHVIHGEDADAHAPQGSDHRDRHLHPGGRPDRLGGDTHARAPRRGTEIKNFGDSIFWVTTQLLTVSSQLPNPISTGARIIDIGLQAIAISVVASLAGSFAAFFHRAGQGARSRRGRPGRRRVVRLSGASGRAARPEAARGSASAPGSTPVARDAASESGAAARSPAGSRSPAAPRARSSRGRRGSRRSACRSRWR